MEVDAEPLEREMTTILEILQKRIELYSENTVIKIKNNNQFILEIPQSDNINDEIIAGIIEKGEVLFEDSDGHILISHYEIQSAEIKNDATNDEYQVYLTFTEKGSEMFAQATETNVGKMIYIYIDNILIQMVNVSEQINSGTCYITGISTLEEAKLITSYMNSGYIPYDIKKEITNYLI